MAIHPRLLVSALDETAHESDIELTEHWSLIVRCEAYVLAYIDAFWLIAWVSLLGILLVLLLRPPSPNPIIPSRGA